MHIFINNNIDYYLDENNSIYFKGIPNITRNLSMSFINR